jgi:hypothetical protein
MNQRFAEPLIDLLAQPVDVYIHDVCQRILVHIPDMLHEHGLDRMWTGIARQILQQANSRGERSIRCCPR